MPKTIMTAEHGQFPCGGRGRGLAFFAALLLPFLAAGPASSQSTHSFNSGMDCNGVWKLPDTGQTSCYDDNTGLPIACPAPDAVLAQDGSYSSPVNQPSYTLNGDGTVTDNVTGLMWVSDAGTTSYSWAAALAYCSGTASGNLNYGSGYAGYTDWRVPNVLEGESLLRYVPGAAPFIDTTAFPNTQATNKYYWTSTTVAATPANAWVVEFKIGSILESAGKTASHYVRCVRGGRR
ncbi:MAG: DUF1566 domain-containing protein [Elusimicrobia bacterium]|nr:DUF1566 domain-containing protein [Elusimicrobiota bacterium]